MSPRALRDEAQERCGQGSLSNRSELTGAPDSVVFKHHPPPPKENHFKLAHGHLIRDAPSWQATIRKSNNLGLNKSPLSAFRWHSFAIIACIVLQRCTRTAFRSSSLQIATFQRQRGTRSTCFPAAAQSSQLFSTSGAHKVHFGKRDMRSTL